MGAFEARERRTGWKRRIRHCTLGLEAAFRTGMGAEITGHRWYRQREASSKSRWQYPHCRGCASWW